MGAGGEVGGEGKKVRIMGIVALWALGVNATGKNLADSVENSSKCFISALPPSGVGKRDNWSFHSRLSLAEGCCLRTLTSWHLKPSAQN